MKWMVFVLVVFVVAAMAVPAEARRFGSRDVDYGASVGRAVIQVVLNVMTGVPVWLGVDLGWPEIDNYNGLVDPDGVGADGDSPPPPGQKPPVPKVVPTTVGELKWLYAGGRR